MWFFPRPWQNKGFLARPSSKKVYKLTENVEETGFSETVNNENNEKRCERN